MKTKTKCTSFILSLILGTILFSGCKSSLSGPEDQYLVGYTFKRSMTATEVTNLYSPLQGTYPDVAGILPSVKLGAKLYSITYHTTLGTKKLIASGLVCIPDGGGTYPMLSFQNGTNTVNANAPSLSPNSYINQLATGIAATGFVTVLPDYLGFGSSTEVFHPYLHLKSTVNPILDMFRAVKEMSAKTDLNFKLSTDLYLMGYSQGGLSTLQLQKTIEASYSNEFNLKAVGCGAGPYDLTQITRILTSIPIFPQPYYIAYIIKGFKSVGAITNPYSDIFNEPYASKIDGLFNGVKDGSVINLQLTSNMSDFLTNDFRKTFFTNAKFQGMRDSLAASSVPAWKIKTPLFLAHGSADTDVPPEMTTQLHSDLITLDETLPVTYIPLTGFDHGTASTPSMINFIKQFLAIKGN